MPSLRFGRVPSSIGLLWVAETDAGVAAVTQLEPLEPFLDALRRRFGGSVALAPGEVDGGWLEAALDGRGTLPPVDLTGLAAFDRSVYEVVRGIPPGEAFTYGEVAAAVGSPMAARAVGNAMARCPLFPAVPCHRVVRASDGWSGWGGGDIELKRRLLDLEAG